MLIFLCQFEQRTRLQNDKQDYPERPGARQEVSFEAFKERFAQQRGRRGRFTLKCIRKKIL